ncbi:MAG: SCO family protein [Burkholderiaceae bacterium]|nr:SCO family protein [Burkholderiaceae bacterium]
MTRSSELPVSQPRRRLAMVVAALALPTAARAATPVPDAALLHRDGRPVRLISDIWRDRVGVVTFVYTSCASFCGMQSAMVAELQSRLAARLGRDLVLISLSIDPLNDDPPRLDAFARAFAPGPHWWWLTGEPRIVFRTLEALGADRGDPRDHSPLWLIGRASGPHRVVGFPSLSTLQAAVEAALRR